MDVLTRIQTTVQQSPIQLASSFAVLYIVYNLARVVYNVYFHPLAKFPGPPSRAGFLAVDMWHHFLGNQVWREHELHEKFGSVVRVSPDTLSFNTAQAWRDIASTKPGKGQLQKDKGFYMPRSGRPNIIVSNDADHSRQRKLLSHAFSDAAIREQEPLITQYFDLLIDKLNQQIEGPDHGVVDVTAWYNFTTFDIIGDLAFGEPFGALEAGSYHVWIKNVFGGIKFGRFLLLGYRYWFFGIFLKTIFNLVPAFGRAQKFMLDFELNKTTKRLDTQTDRKDFMTYILRYNDKRGMSRDEIVGNSGILIVAGSETTATLLSGATYYLLKNPAVLEKLKAEVRGRFQSADDINVVSTGQLQYLHAVLEESLRRYPPVPFRLPRRTGSEDEIIDGHTVPPKTSVAVNHFSTYNMEHNFHNPEAFVPERWLPDAPEEYKDDVKAAFQPFSFGPRNCLGKNLAYIEMRSILGRIIWHYDMELQPASKDWAEKGNQKAYTVWEKPPLWVKLSKREGA